MAPYDSPRPPGALALHQAMHHWLPAEVSARVAAALDDLKKYGRKVWHRDARGREVTSLDEYSDHNLALLQAVQEAQDAAAARFVAMLRAGRLAALGRIGSPLAPMRPIPADAWDTLAIRHVAEGRASGGGIDVFALHVAPPPPAAPFPAAPTAASDHPPTAPAAAAPPEPERPPSRPRPYFKRDVGRAWYRLRVAGWPQDAPAPSEADDLAAIRAEFAGKIPRDFIREIRRELAPSDWRKSGPRPPR